jgi:hypothetical protein
VVGGTTDKVLISKTRLLRVLTVLGLIREESQFLRVSGMLDQLWKECREYLDAISSFDPSTSPTWRGGSSSAPLRTVTYDAVDVEVEIRTSVPSEDHVTLGALRWVAFGVPRAAPFLSRWRSCLPCSSRKTNKKTAATHPTISSPEEQGLYKLHQSHPIHTCGLRQHSGELVRHEVQTCLLCVSMTGNHGLIVAPPSPQGGGGCAAGVAGQTHVGALERGGDYYDGDYDAMHGRSRSDSTIFSPPSSPDSPLATTDATAMAQGRQRLRGSSSVGVVKNAASTGASLEDEEEENDDEEPASEEVTAHALNELLCEAQLPSE